jgi:hypothetical protein
MFPREVMNRFPLLPLEEEGRLNDMPLRENFVERVFAYYRWTELLDKEPTPSGLVPGKPIQGCHLSGYTGPRVFTHSGPPVFTQTGPPVFTEDGPLVFAQTGPG